MNIYEGLHEILDYTDPIYDDTGSGFHTTFSTMFEGVMYKVPDVHDRDVWHCNYPYFNFTDQAGPRWVAIVKHRNGKLVAVQISNYSTKVLKRDQNGNYITDGLSEDQIQQKIRYEEKANKLPYMYRLENYDREGFTRPTIALGNTFFDLKYIKFNEKKGVLLDTDYEGISKAIEAADRARFSSPMLYISWVKNHAIAPGTSNSIDGKAASLITLQNTLHGDCFDVINGLHTVCDNARWKHSMQLLVVTDKNDKVYYHPIVIYRDSTGIVAACTADNTPIAIQLVVVKPNERNKLNTAIDDAYSAFYKHIKNITGLSFKHIDMSRNDIFEWESAFANKTVKRELVMKIIESSLKK